jgi:hypothetical protein
VQNSQNVPPRKTQRPRDPEKPSGQVNDVDKELQIIGTLVLTATEDLYRLVDFLNRNLKDKNVVFGLSKVKDDPGKMMLTLYRA